MTRGTPFAPGQSGNPGGKPKTAEVSALARRYTVDAIRGLVAVARLEAPSQTSARVAACRALVEIGNPGLAKQAFDGEAVNVLHMHLLAVMAAPQPGAAPGPGTASGPGAMQVAELMQLRGPADDELDDLAALEIADGMLPEAQTAPPEEALPLWDASSYHGFAKTDPASRHAAPVRQAQSQGRDEAIGRAVKAPQTQNGPIGFGDPADAPGIRVTCPHCGDVTYHDRVFARISCGGCCRPFAP